MKNNYFTKNIEKMINPMEVGTISFMQSYTKFIPISLQNKIILSGAKKNPHMGFVVEPYSFFLCYELKDLEMAKKLIPDGYELIKTKIFEDDEPGYYCIFGSFNVHTSAFWGTRMEFYIIAENKKTGLLSWVIIDYNTNTTSHDDKNGLSSGNTSDCIFTTNYQGKVIIDIKDKNQNRELVVESSVLGGKETKLDQRLWLEGNLSVAYGRELSKNKGEAFAVIFNHKEVEKSLCIPCEDAIIESNTWFPGLFNQKPTRIACFPFAQHFLADSPGHFSTIKNKKELEEKMATLDFENMPKYSGKSFKKMFAAGQIFSGLIILVLLILLYFK